MTFPDQLHDIINDPVKEKAVLDLIKDECLKEYGKWREPSNEEWGMFHSGAIGATANLLCAFNGLLAG